MNHPNTGHSDWRELSDQLTAGQIQALTDREQLHPEIPSDLLRSIAEDHARGNRDDERFAHIPKPPRTLVGHWQHTPSGWRREIEGTVRDVAGVGIWVGGWQDASGAVSAFVGIDGGGQLNPVQALRVAAAVCEAADETATLSGLADTLSAEGE